MPPETEMDQLQEIMDELPESGDYSPERRKYSLTQGDVMLIYKIARIAYSSHVCPFRANGEAETLHDIAVSVSKSKSIGATAAITAIVTAFISGAGYVIWHALKDALAAGGGK